MATYFIDYENTHSLNGINELTKEDSVFIAITQILYLSIFTKKFLNAKHISNINW